MTDPQPPQALAPTPSAFDRRVLAALDQWPGDGVEVRDGKLVGINQEGEPLEWRTVWQVAERVGEPDVRDIARVLDGLERFGHATARQAKRHGRRVRVWVATPGRGTQA